MTDIKVVIGANFGDEGKGLMTDYFCNEALKKKRKSIVVCSNGGAQRGHTVSTKEGVRHIFHHFGSGTLVGSDTYLCQFFILNPIIFRDEYNELERLGKTPKVYVHPKCIWSTPFDMIINQIIEAHRGKNRHGSCGIGIWETVVRNRKNQIYIEEVLHDKSCVKKFLENIRDVYLPDRLNELGIKEIPKEWQEIIYSPDLINQYIEDLYFMLAHIMFSDNSILNNYDSIVFENGQGLLLDQNIKGYGENTTPSNTGCKNIIAVLEDFKKEYTLEICYVTRTYLTRHGAGRFDTECDKEEINSMMVDETNVPNPHQGTIRYGKIRVAELISRIKEDCSDIRDKKISLAITHMNETERVFVTDEEISMNDVKKSFDKVYNSYGMDREWVNI